MAVLNRPAAHGRPAQAAARQTATPTRVRHVLQALALPALLLLLWQVSAVNQWVSPQILPTPQRVLATFTELLLSGEISEHLRISLQRIASGLLLGGVSGLAIGIWLGTSAWARRYVEPTLVALFSVPTLGWIPILILIFGIEETLKILVIAKAVLVPVVLHATRAIRQIPQSYIEAARVLRLRPWTRLTRLTLPACFPVVFSGFRLGLSHAFIALVVVEMLAATEGIGYMMVWGRTLFQLDIVIVGILVVGVVGFSLDVALRQLERRIGRWQPGHD